MNFHTVDGAFRRSNRLRMTSLPKRAAYYLRSLADAVEAAPPAIQTTYRVEFSKLATINKTALKSELQAALGINKTAIYTVKIDSRDQCHVARNLMINAREAKIGDRKYSRVLRPFEESEYLYVGSSRDVTKRIVEHFGFGPKATYSLHLASWAGSLPGEVEIGITMYEDIDREVLCALEDHLARELKPMFGRRGSV